MRKLLIAVAAVAALIAAGCAPEVAATEEDTPAKATTQKPADAAADPEEPKADPALREYTDAAASFDPVAMRETAKDLTVPGSVAEAYLLHLANNSEAALDGGTMYPEYGAPTAKDGGLQYCASDIDGAKACTIWGNFKTSEGKITDLTVDGKEIGPRLTLGGNTTVQSGGATWEFLSAYRSIQSEALWVVVKVTTTNAIDVFSYEAKYRAPDGKQRTAAQADGPTELAADSTAMIAFAFPGAQPGGSVTVEGCANDCMSDYTATINVGK
ncbi:hypothetical protein [Actinopolymorpha sp. B9G3]|uniref:hypothetical protein n=1 Tax=Actinopolymorpha sp. B9G3 TaxID=3158970 RepID=UPI0032D94F9D